MTGTEKIPVDDLAQEIRRVDGNHDLGAGALAEALMPFLEAKITYAVATGWSKGYDVGWEDGEIDANQKAKEAGWMD